MADLASLTCLFAGHGTFCNLRHHTQAGKDSEANHAAILATLMLGDRAEALVLMLFCLYEAESRLAPC